jgi:hypothetical protein
MHAALHVDLICAEGTISYPHQIIRAQGTPCGSEGYYYLPCEAQTETVDFPEPPTSSAVFAEQGDCLFIGRENPQIYCPALLMDTCSWDTGVSFVTIVVSHSNNYTSSLSSLLTLNTASRNIKWIYLICSYWFGPCLCR